MYTHSGSYLNIDPNVGRLLEETLAICNDVDQRIQALRVGIAHAYPPLAPVALSGGLGVRGNFGVNSSVNPFTGAPIGVSLPIGDRLMADRFVGHDMQTLAALGLLPNVGGHIGSLGIQGINRPWTGVTHPSAGVGFGSFRGF